MKKKILLLFVMLIGLMIGASNEVYAICTECENNNCGSCSGQKQYTYQDDTKHRIDCCCGGTSLRSDSHTGGTATCSSKKVCSYCNKGYGEYGDHSYNSYFTTDKYATCTTKGSKSKHCKNCSAKTSETEIPATGHDWDYKDDDYHECLNCGSQGGHSLSWNGNTGSGGKHYMVCSTCGYTPARNCSGGTATCTAAAVCSTCGASYGSANGHSNSNYGYCTGEKCSVCSNITGSYYHSYGSWSNYDDTQHRKKCSRSGCRNPYSYADHSVSVTSYTTTSSQHTEVKTCSDCTYSTSGATGDHSWNTSHICTVCSYEGTHDYKESDNYYPCRSPEDEHIRYYYCECGSSTGKNFKHTNKTVDSGYHQCVYCTAKTEHTWGSYVYDTSSEHTMTCSSCSAGYNGAHNSDTRVANCTQKPICSLCDSEWGSINSSNHNYTKTCTKCNTESVICSRSSSHVKSHDCSIYITPPTVTNQRWTGSAITGLPSGTGYSRSGTYSETAVGTYTATATLTGGTEPTYRWSDTGTVEARTYTWSILDVPVGNISGPSAVQVKTGGTATFSVSADAGSHITYQWYYNTANSTTGGTAISGATSNSYSVTVDQSMNGRYYYCILSNNSDSSSSLTGKASSTALLTVWWSHSISAHPVDTTVKKGETASFTVTATGGNPSTYTYQWYSVASATGGSATVISGATSSTYSFVPTANIHEMWYYCVVGNTHDGIIEYEVTSNRAKLIADVTSPVINVGSPSVAYANKDTSFTVPLTVTDTGEGFNTSSFTDSDIVIKVNGTAITPTVKTLEYVSSNGDNHTYTLTLQGVTGDGILTVEVAAGNIADNFGNTNASTSMVVSGITIDNIAPVISSNGEVTGTDEGYINEDDTITIPIKITDIGGIDPSELTPGDIIVHVGDETPEGVVVTVTYEGGSGDDDTYIITVSGITGDGELTLEIEAGKIEDLAGNPNENTIISGLNVFVDNTKPVITDVVLSLGSYNNTSRLYPESLPTSNESWINESVYVVINATDEGYGVDGVESYWHSEDNKVTFEQMTSDRETWADEMENTIYYKVIDNAGNESEYVGVSIKIDKTDPNAAGLNMRLDRENGVEYIYDATDPASSSIHIKPTPTTDNGTYQSGILKTEYIITFDNGVEITTSDPVDGSTGTLLKETGTYVIEVITTDKAGNTSNNFFNAAIEKKTENTVKVNNIHDEGSGVTTVTITARKQNASVDAIEPIVITNPGASINQRIKLTDGTFIVKVQIVDGVGLTTELQQTIINEL